LLSALRAFGLELAAVLLRTIAYVGGLGGLAFVALQFIDSTILLAVPSATARSDWVPMDRLNPAFQLALGERGESIPEYAVLRHATGGGRKDIFTLGAPGARYLRIEIYRPGGESRRFGDPAEEVAARTEDFHRVGRIRPAPDLETKFGAFALMHFAIRPEREIGNCAGFVRSFQEPRLQIVGLACNDSGALIDREALACALDRVTLLAAGSDAKTGGLFAHAEINRNFCGRTPLLAETHKRREAHTPLKLRGRLAAR
jgi:hypothetical protein